MNPCTTFAGGINPFCGFAKPPEPEEPYRTTGFWGAPARRIFDVICQRPGLTGGDLIKLTKNYAASEYAKMLMDAGEVDGLMQRTKRHQAKAGVLHYYPKTGTHYIRAEP